MAHPGLSGPHHRPLVARDRTLPPWVFWNRPEVWFSRELARKGRDLLYNSVPTISRLDDRTATQPYSDLTAPITWRDQAACLDLPGVDFFPFPEDIEAISLVKEICAPCPVANECLTHALDTRQTDGVWGGLTPRERTNLRRKSMESRNSG